MDKKGKLEFLSIASHQLRMPLAVIKGYLSLILEDDFGSPGSELKKVLKISDNKLNQMFALTENVMDLIKIDFEMVKLKKEKVNIEEQIRSIIETFQDRIKEKELVVDFQPPPNLLGIYVDVDIFQQVIVKVLNNAIKYTPSRGKIKIVIREYNEKIKLQIIDNGIGISEEEIKHIFDRFYKVDKRSEGDGLGLSVVKEMVKLCGGRITVKSKIGEGTSFTISFPK